MPVEKQFCFDVVKYWYYQKIAMLTLILLLVVGSFLAYLAQDNLVLVSVNFGPYVISGVPLFYVIVGSLVTGLAVAYVIYLTEAISKSLAMRAKDVELKKSKQEVLELTKRVHQLEIEKEKIKRVTEDEDDDPRAL